jgi:oxygen-independent coproporphyrinogen-3 oxidase
MAGIYLHIPFCKQACHYCDFHFSTNLELKEKICAAIQRELSLQNDYLAKQEVSTIYFGGGTPSLLSSPEIKAILDTIHSTFQVSATAEITLEANPDDLSREKLAILFATGINRLSIGVQSFDNETLRFLNRAHSGTEATQCIEDARMVGFKNLSLDLIYAIPGQTIASWKDNIIRALDLSPEHFSTYSLTVEEKTVFGHHFKKGKLKTVSEDIAAEEFEILMSELAKAGYEHYEISNFCKPGFQSQHNSNYWKGAHYLGIGPSAHSFNGDSRQFNVSNNSMYLNSISQGIVPFEKEALTRENKINEHIFTTLRTSWGVDLSFLKNELEYDLLNNQSLYINDLEKRGLAKLTNGKLVLTNSGKLLADKIASDLFTAV